MNQYDIYYNGTNLNEIVGGMISYHDFNALPNRDIKQSTLARANRSVVTAAFWTSKTISISFFAHGCTRTQSEAILRRLSGLASVAHKTLQVLGGVPTLSEYGYDYEGETLEWHDCILNSVSMDWTGNLPLYTMEFIALDPLAYGDTQTLLTETVTANSGLWTFSDIQGTFETQYPTITMTINSVELATDPNIEISFDAVNYLKISKAFDSDSTVVIDTFLKTVIVNNVPTIFTGALTPVSLDGGALHYTDGFYDRDIDIVVTNQARYI